MALAAGLAAAAFRAAVPSYLRAGLSGAAAYRKFRTLGVGGLRKQTYQGIFREMSGISKMENTFKFIRKDYLPSVSSYYQTKTVMPREYMYKVRLDILNEDGSFSRNQYYSVMSDEEMSPGDAAAKALDGVDEMYSDTEGQYFDNPLTMGGFRSLGA